MFKKPKDLSASEGEERGHGEGGGVYATLLQSDTVQPYGRTKAGTILDTQGLEQLHFFPSFFFLS